MSNVTRTLAGIAAVAVCLATAFPCMAGRMRAGDGLTLQQAIDAAQPGDVISLPTNFYPGSVVINNKSDIEIRGTSAVVHPFPQQVIGIHIIGSTNITLNGFVVRNFERAIVIENPSFCTVKGMSIDTNWDKSPNSGGFLADGIVLINSHQNDITRNRIFGSGNNAILLTANSSGNTIRSNNIHDNGFQTDGIESGGSGIALDGGNQVDNMISGNTIWGNRWGIYLGPNGASSENQITRNKSTGNGRAGIALRGGAENNLVKGNTVSGNNTMGMAPSTPHDIFDDSTGSGNTYDRNKGSMGGPGL